MTPIHLIVCFLIFFCSQAQANVTGVCSNCHVMHASSAGVVSGIGPQEGLLNSTCLGCHTGTNTDGTSHTPYVYSGVAITDLTTSLAAGNFYFSDSTSQRYGHNPQELPGGVDSTLNAPPGWITGFSVNDQVGTINNAVGATKLSCSGVYGCHGRHNGSGGLFGLEASHHNNITNNIGMDQSTTGKSFRFLYGIKGWESGNYQFNDDATDYNIYYSENRASDAATDTATISYFCAECHGIFHSGESSQQGVSEDGSAFSSPWIRHPVDVQMPTGTTEYNSYVYTPAIPVGSNDISNGTITVASERIVMCLSCHRAHASPYYSSLRWNYRGASGSWTNGCAACHTEKN
nr:hypothetical protein [Desulfobulbaceae bacterium]